MPKAPFMAILIVCLGAGLAAQGVPETKPREGWGAGGFFVDLYPMLNWSTEASASVLSDQAFSRFYDRPAIVSGGLCLKAGPAKALVTYEFQQDVWSWVEKKSLLNLPDDVDSFLPTVAGLGTFYPNLGYLEVERPAWHLSLGRRKLQVGPGSIGLGLSSANPHYDHVAAGIAAPLGHGRINYDYIDVIIQRWDVSASSTRKFFAMHRAAWESPGFTLGLTEYNLVNNPDPDFQDLGPFVFYHNLFESASNVMLGLDFQARILEPLAAYGQFILDDFQLGSEGSGSNPTAIGLALGLRWKLLPGNKVGRPAFRESEHVFRVGGDGETTGLVARLEAYLASTYLWRRDQSAPEEAMLGRYMIISNWPNHWGPLVTPFFANPLAPDSFLARARLDWEGGRVQASLLSDLRVRGSQAGEPTYDRSAIAAGSSWFWPSAPSSLELSIGLESLYAIDPRSVANLGLSLSFLPSRVDFGCSLGYGLRLGAGENPRH